MTELNNTYNQESMINESSDGQSHESTSRNKEFFANFSEYGNLVNELEIYANIRRCIEVHLAGVEHLCDIGNGNVFNYSTEKLKKITALDLFLDKVESKETDGNIERITGSALNIPFCDEMFDCVLLSMLLHHLTGNTAVGNLANARCAVSEAYRVLKPGGKCIIVESCLPAAIYQIERIAYPCISWIVRNVLSHPPTFQYSKKAIKDLMFGGGGGGYTEQSIQRGRWQLFLGMKLPTIILPTFPVVFVVTKPGKLSR